MNLAELNAYELISGEDLGDIHAEGYLLRHKKSGARIGIIPNDDENKVFYIAFRTPVSDSTGVPHIIEHSVLCGSEKFPVKDPFVELVKGSLNTFLNAMTYPDKTVYPVASCNDRDFANLMDVYLDAVFHPDIYKKEEIFRQEGWHYELESEDAPIAINGVVYNEMKGVFSSPDDVMSRMVLNSLFPDTTYSNESGGDPEVIPELTYESYLDFHRRYYHPSNSYIYLYGDMDMEERLRFLDQEYLSKYDVSEIDSAIGAQQPFAHPVELHRPYSLASGEPLEDNTFLSYNAVVGTVLDQELCMAFDVLDYALLGAPGAPVKQALLDAGIGKDVMGGFDSGTYQPVFSVVAKNANSSDGERFVQVIEDTLRKVAAEGLNPKSLLAGLNSAEFRFREADYGNYPKGLMYGLTCMDSWLYDENQPFLYLKVLPVFEKLREKVSSGYFEELITKYLLSNMHKSYVYIEPEHGCNARLEEALAQKLKEYKDSLTPEELQCLIADTNHLKEYQEEPSAREDLEKIPMLKREDMKREIAPLIYEEKTCGGVPVIHTNIYSGGIHYLQLLFEAKQISGEDVPYLGILKAVLGYVDTEHYGYADLANEINLMTGGISSQVSAYADVKAEDVYDCKFEIHAKMLYQNLGSGLELVREILNTSDVTNEKRLYEIVAQAKSRLQMSLSSAGHAVSAVRAMSYFSPASKFNDDVGGIGLYQVVADLEEHFEERKAGLIARLQRLMRQLFVKEGLLISVTADDEGYALFEQELPKWLETLGTKGHAPDTMPENDEKRTQKDAASGTVNTHRNEGFQDASKVQYVSRAGNFCKAGFSYTGALKILKVILSYDYLWINVRVKGGAYGCMSGFSRTGETYFSSYRDPNLRKTNEVYEGIPGYLRGFEADERDMTKYIIGTVSGLDTPLTPAAKGGRAISAYLTHVTEEDLQRERDQVIDAQPEDIRGLADLMEAVLAQEYLCVIGSEDALRENAEMFRELKELYERS